MCFTVDELLVVLLEHTNREVVYTVCGVLMNLLSDPEYRHVMLKNELAGVDNLIEVSKDVLSYTILVKLPCLNTSFRVVYLF